MSKSEIYMCREFICAWHITHSCVTWLILRAPNTLQLPASLDPTHRDTQTYMYCEFIRVWDMTHSCVPWLISPYLQIQLHIHTCALNRFICGTWPIHACHDSFPRISRSGCTYIHALWIDSSVGHDPFMRAMTHFPVSPDPAAHTYMRFEFIYLWDMTHSCVPWLLSPYLQIQPRIHTCALKLFICWTWLIHVCHDLFLGCQVLCSSLYLEIQLRWHTCGGVVRGKLVCGCMWGGGGGGEAEESVVEWNYMGGWVCTYVGKYIFVYFYVCVCL